MPLRKNRWAGTHQRTRPSGRHLGTALGLLALSAALLTWAGTSLVDARVDDTRAVEPTTLVVPARDGDDARQVVRSVRKAMTPIEPPLSGSTSLVRPAGTTVEPPVDVPDPVRITIPALDIDQDLTELAVNGNELQVPESYGDIGWWGAGPVPGSPGAGVVVGHVDSRTGPAVFYRLSGLVPGNQVEVLLDDGSRVVFAVQHLAVYDKADFPTAEVYRTSGRPSLNLITCGGSFDTGIQEYVSNVVVSTRLVRRIPAPGSRPSASDTARTPAPDQGDGGGGAPQQAEAPNGPPDATTDGEQR